MLTNAGKGRPKGSVNKLTANARIVISDLVDNHAHMLVKWLNEVAEGKKGEVVAKNGEVKEVYLVEPNPAKAFDMFQSIIEYHIPKLARTEVVGNAENPIVHEHRIKAKEMMDEVLTNIELKSADE